MPNAVTDYGSQQFAGICFGISSVPTHWYVALCTDEPGSDWDGSMLADLEPSGQAGYTGTVYARQMIGHGSGSWTLSDSGYVVNAVDINFGIPDVDWGTISHLGLTDAVTAGNLWLYGGLAVPADINANFTVIIPAGSLTIAVANLESSIAV